MKGQRNKIGRVYTVYGNFGGGSFEKLGRVAVVAPVGCLLDDAYVGSWLHGQFGRFIAIDHKMKSVALPAREAAKFLDSKLHP